MKPDTVLKNKRLKELLVSSLVRLISAVDVEGEEVVEKATDIVSANTTTQAQCFNDCLRDTNDFGATRLSDYNFGHSIHSCEYHSKCSAANGYTPV